MKTEPQFDIVEMIDDDGDAFGHRSTDGTSHDTGGGSRWAGPIAAALLIAVVGYGVISSAIDSDPTAVPAVPGGVGARYYVADPPPGFALYTAADYEQTGAPSSDFEDNGPAQLWATADATGTQGAWFLVSRGVRHATGRNAYRTMVDTIEVVIEREPSSRLSRVSFTKDGTAIEITARGWADRQLVRLVRAVAVDRNTVNFSDDFFETDHQRILDADPDLAFLGRPVARVEYHSDASVPLADQFTITVADDNVERRTTVEQFALTDVSPFAVGDHAAVIGRSVADPSISIAQWHDEDRLITVSGSVAPQQLQAIAQTVHSTSDEDVRDQLVALSSRPSPVAQFPTETIGAGTLPDGLWWSVQVSAVGPTGSTTGYLWWFNQLGDSIRRFEPRPSLPSGGPTIETFVHDGTAYVVAKVPRSMAGAELHVNPTNLPSIVVPFLEVDRRMPDVFAVVAVAEPVPFAVQIVDETGGALAVWPEF